MTSPLLRPALCVLDTQVLLDWALFDDPRVRPWSEAVQRGSVRWIYCAAMRVEALRVVHYPALAKRFEPQASADKVADCFARWGQCCADPPSQRQLICSDPDDQVFLDLALTQTAATLLSRDQAVLRLARAARSVGLAIGSPEQIATPI